MALEGLNVEGLELEHCSLEFGMRSATPAFQTTVDEVGRRFKAFLHRAQPGCVDTTRI